jgi:tRNA A37 methylthiotransferase MiaB
VPDERGRRPARRRPPRIRRLPPRPHARDAGLLLLNTCVVRQQAEDKIYSRLTYIAELKQKNPALVVALMGCLVGKNPREIAALRERFPFVDLFLPPSDLAPLREFLQARGLATPPAAPKWTTSRRRPCPIP